MEDGGKEVRNHLDVWGEEERGGKKGDVPQLFTLEGKKRGLLLTPLNGWKGGGKPFKSIVGAAGRGREKKERKREKVDGSL